MIVDMRAMFSSIMSLNLSIVESAIAVLQAPVMISGL
jgi:hypothetical protein